MASVRAQNMAYRAALAALGWVESGWARMSHPTLRGRAAHDSAGRAVRNVTRVRLTHCGDIRGERFTREFPLCRQCKTCGVVTGPHESHSCDTDMAHHHTQSVCARVRLPAVDLAMMSPLEISTPFICWALPHRGLDAHAKLIATLNGVLVVWPDGSETTACAGTSLRWGDDVVGEITTAVESHGLPWSSYEFLAIERAVSALVRDVRRITADRGYMSDGLVGDIASRVAEKITRMVLRSWSGYEMDALVSMALYMRIALMDLSWMHVIVALQASMDVALDKVSVRRVVSAMDEDEYRAIVGYEPVDQNAWWGARDGNV